jgi:hypothetical protein
MPDAFTLDLVLRLGKTAVRTEHKQLNIFVHELLQHCIRVCTVYDCTIGVRRIGRLSTQLAPKKLVNFRGGTMKTQSNVSNVGNHRFDTISTAFDLPKDAGHFIAVGWIIYGGETGNINNGTRRGHLGIKTK